MNNDEIRKVFEKEWGYTNEEQGLIFNPELNVYVHKDHYWNNELADIKSCAWFYFQKGFRKGYSEGLYFIEGVLIK